MLLRNRWPRPAFASCLRFSCWCHMGVRGQMIETLAIDRHDHYPMTDSIIVRTVVDLDLAWLR